MPRHITHKLQSLYVWCLTTSPNGNRSSVLKSEFRIIYFLGEINGFKPLSPISFYLLPWVIICIPIRSVHVLEASENRLENGQADTGKICLPDTRFIALRWHQPTTFAELTKVPPSVCLSYVRLSFLPSFLTFADPCSLSPSLAGWLAGSLPPSLLNSWPSSLLPSLRPSVRPCYSLTPVPWYLPGGCLVMRTVSLPSSQWV